METNHYREKAEDARQRARDECSAITYRVAWSKIAEGYNALAEDAERNAQQAALGEQRRDLRNFLYRA
jgi:L-asparaginase II